MIAIIFSTAALCIALLTWNEVRRLKGAPEPDAESARKAKEAIDRFNEGIAGILDYDGGGK